MGLHGFRLGRFMGPGVFPHELAWFLELPWRRFLLSPQTLCARLDLEADSIALEVGAGSGYYTRFVSERLSRGHVVALDLQPEMVNRNRRSIDGRGSVSFLAADAAVLPFGQATFDRVFMVAVFGEVADAKGCLAEIHRVLKRDGLLSISEHVPDPDFTRLGRLADHVSKHGFRLDSDYGPPWAYTANFRPVER